MKTGNAATTNLQILRLLQSTWSKKIEPSRQSSTHHPLIVCNPIDKKGLEFMRKSMRWEAPSMPTAAYDPTLLREPQQIGKNWFLGQRFQQVVAWGCYGAHDFSLSRTLSLSLSFVLFLFLCHRNFHDCPCEQDKYTHSRTTRIQSQCSPVLVVAIDM